MKVAIVTGASSGLGREFVKQLEHLYARLDEIWVIARRSQQLHALQKEVQVPLRFIVGDLTEASTIRALKQHLSIQQPDVRMLVNNAGFGKIGAFEANVSAGAEVENDVQTEMVELNCTALTKVIEVVLPYMNPGARLVNIASAAAYAPQPYFAVYAATKAYVKSLSLALGAELKEREIFVTCVCPGPVDTEFFDRAGILEMPLKKLITARPKNVVRKALLDARKRKSISVYGLPMMLTTKLIQLVPMKLVMKFYTRA